MLFGSARLRIVKRTSLPIVSGAVMRISITVPVASLAPAKSFVAAALRFLTLSLRDEKGQPLFLPRQRTLTLPRFGTLATVSRVTCV